MSTDTLKLALDLAVDYGSNFHLHLQMSAWIPVAFFLAWWKKGSGPPGSNPGGPPPCLPQSRMIKDIIMRKTI